MDHPRAAVCAAVCAALLLAAAAAPPRYSSRIVHTHAGAIRGIIVEPASRRLEPVEVFRGVPYAAPPARLAAPPPPPRWPGTRLADTFAPTCPQALPDISNKTAALMKMPLGVYNDLVASYPVLSNQSEDCLYLDIYVPGSGARGVEAPYAVAAWLGGAGGALDGAVLAARGSLLVVAINYRVGLLGFLTPGAADGTAQAAGVSAAGGAGVLDVVAALRWLRRAAPAFGGDAARVALVAPPDHAATLAAVLLLPQAKGLASRALVLGGGALGPHAFMPDAALARSHAAMALRCDHDAAPQPEHWLERCVRARPLAALLGVEAPRARFLAGWAPCPAPPPAPPAPAAAPAAPSIARALQASEAFLECSLAIVLCTTESYQFFSEDEIRHGFEEEQRNRILRTFVRNVFRYHRNEILAAARNEYTDWDKPIQHPANIRDATLAALSDALAAAPALRLAALHAARGAPTHLAHLAHAPRSAPARLGSVTGDAVPYFLGLPLVGAGGRNFSRADVAVAEACVALLANFAKTGDPSSKDDKDLVWPRYDTNTQQYLSIGSKLRVRSHYRGHKTALWLHLVPALHRAAPPAPRAHHRLRPASPASPDMFDGDIFPELSTTTVSLDDEEEAVEPPAVEECEPSPSARPAIAAPSPPPSEDPTLNALDAQYYSYTVALGVTVGAGCVLLALNVLVFAGIYVQRARRAARAARAARPRDRGSTSSRACAGSLTCDPTTLTSPRKSTLKRSSESELKERPSAAPPKKRVQIQEISV